MKARIHNVKIEAIATAVPDQLVSIKEIMPTLTQKELDAIYNVTGIRSLRLVKNETASDLCQIAANKLFSDYDKNKIEAIIFVSQTPDYILPATSSVIQHQLGLANSLLCLDISSGCTGYIHGLITASSLISSGAAKSILLLVGDTSSKLVNKKDRTTSVIFGDAGSATIIEKCDTGSIYFDLNNDGEKFENLIIRNGGFRNPKKNSENFDLDFIQMKGLEVFDFAIREIPKLVKLILNDNNLTMSDIDFIAAHQANQLITKTIGKKLGVDESKIPFLCKDFGNTGPASIPLMLSLFDSIDECGMEKVMMCGFGTGLSWGAALCDLSKTKIHKLLQTSLN